jgi:sulfoxide reductase heme-binding subunit YedZ
VNAISTYLRRHWFWLIVNVAAAVPLLWLAWDMLQGNLSANPIDEITDRTGQAAIILLILSLACTPAHTVFGFKQAISVRKALGMFAFVYASFHLLNFVGLDYGFNLQLIFADAILTKPYILVGLAAFLILTPLAITSTKGWMKRLGKNWKRLHRLVYVAGVAAVLHFLWLAKAAEDWEPLLYGVILTILLLLRVPVIRRSVVQLRQRIVSTPAAPAKPTQRAGARPARVNPEKSASIHNSTELHDPPAKLMQG